MTFTPTVLKGSFLISILPHGDSRGWFARTWCKKEFARIGHTKEWVQINHSFTALAGTIRGMHYQLAPFTEIKMVRCIAGSIYDVIVDVRKHSPSYLQWFGAELSSTNKQMMYIPEGFAHGFQTLTNNVELIYHHSSCYTPEAEAGIFQSDSTLAIKWPLPLADISERDRLLPIIDNNFKAL